MKDTDNLIGRVIDNHIRNTKHNGRTDSNLKFTGYQMKHVLASSDIASMFLAPETKIVWKAFYTETAQNGSQDYEYNMSSDDILVALIDYLEERGI